MHTYCIEFRRQTQWNVLRTVEWMSTAATIITIQTTEQWHPDQVETVPVGLPTPTLDLKE